MSEQPAEQSTGSMVGWEWGCCWQSNIKFRLSSKGKTKLDLKRHLKYRLTLWSQGLAMAVWQPLPHTHPHLLAFLFMGFCSPFSGSSCCVFLPLSSPPHEPQNFPGPLRETVSPTVRVRYGQNAFSLTLLEKVSWPWKRFSLFRPVQKFLSLARCQR